MQYLFQSGVFYILDTHNVPLSMWWDTPGGKIPSPPSIGVSIEVDETSADL